MQITIEDLSPVEKRVEFELPWADVVPKLAKAYDSLRRGVLEQGAVECLHKPFSDTALFHALQSALRTS